MPVIDLTRIAAEASHLRTNKASRRVIAGVLVNATGKAWVLILQLIAIPVLSRAWGAEGYGTWMMLSAVPTYVALGGLGFGNAAATEMTRRVSQADEGGALSAFQSVWLLVTGAVGIIGLAAALLLTFGASLHAHRGIAISTQTAGIILILYSLLAVQASLVHAGYRSTGRYAQGTLLMDLGGLAEGLGVIATAALGGDFVGAALTMLAIRAGTLALLYTYIRRQEPWFRAGYRQANANCLRRLAKPAAASLGLAASNALAIQGVVVTLGVFVSPSAVAIYTATRTLCRIPLQLSDLVSRATLPELTSAHASGALRRFHRLTLLNVLVALLLSLPFVGGLAIGGAKIADFISHGHIQFDPDVFRLVLFATCCQILWMALSQSFQATNRHHAVSFPYLVLTAIAALSPAVWAHSNAALKLVSLTVAATELLMACWSVRFWMSERRSDRARARLSSTQMAASHQQ